MSLRVFVSAPYCRRERAARFALSMARLGFTSAHAWYANPKDDCHLSPSDKRDLAAACHEAIADPRTVAFVHLIEPPELSSRGGTHVELGIALARGLCVIASGPVECNAFHFHPAVVRVADDGEALGVLSSSLTVVKRL